MSVSTLLPTGQGVLNAPIRPRATDLPVPLTPIQRRAWNYLNTQGRSLSLRMPATAVHVSGPLDVGALHRSILALIHRHESLRTRLILVDGVPWQHFDTAVEYRLNIIDLSAQAASDAQLQVKVLVQEFLDEKIDVMTGPLFEAKLWKLSAGEHVLVLVIDHLVSDGVSIGILTREMWALYDQAVRGREFSLPPLRVQFADYAVWLQETDDSWMQKHGSYWRERLKGACPLVIPSLAGSTEEGSTYGLTAHIPFGSALSSSLRDSARCERTLLSLVVLSSFAIVLSNWCQQSDLILQFVSHGRHRRPELQNVIGWLANLIYFRISLGPEDTFRSLLTQINREFSCAFLHQDFDRVPDFIPECQSEGIFNWQPTSWAGGRLDHSFIPECALALDQQPDWERGPARSPAEGGDFIRIRPFAARTPTSVKFNPIFFDTSSEIHMTVPYRPDKFAPKTIEQFGRNLLFVLGRLAMNPSTRIADATAPLSWD